MASKAVGNDEVQRSLDLKAQAFLLLIFSISVIEIIIVKIYETA
jgi:hypothetical protein